MALGAVSSQDILAEARSVARESGTSSWVGLMRVLTDQLERFPLPADVLPAFAAAQTHWNGEDDDVSPLSTAKELVWNYLGRYPTGEDVKHEDGRLARALLCVLEPDGDAEAASLTAEWYADMVSGRQEPR